MIVLPLLPTHLMLGFVHQPSGHFWPVTRWLELPTFLPEEVLVPVVSAGPTTHVYFRAGERAWGPFPVEASAEVGLPGDCVRLQLRGKLFS